jgi:hypothetical protein
VGGAGGVNVGGGVGVAVGLGVGVGASGGVGVGVKVGAGVPPGNGVGVGIAVGSGVPPGGVPPGAGGVVVPPVGPGGADQASAVWPSGEPAGTDVVALISIAPGDGLGAGVASGPRGTSTRSISAGCAGTTITGTGPGPDQIGAATTNGARTMTTTSPIVIPAPVCVSFDGIAVPP